MRYFYSAIQKGLEFFFNRNNRGAKIFMFHQVNNDRKRWKEPSVCITETSFKYFIEQLMYQGYLFKAIHELNVGVDNKSVFLTFDDIFCDVIEIVVPYLKEKGIPFCVFVSDIYIEQEDFVSSEQLKELVKEPLCTIGYHTKSHKSMRKLSKTQVYEEVDCTEIEKKINKGIEYFAFPYGSVYACSRKSINIVKKKQYKMSFSTISAPCTKFWLKYFKSFVPRINVNEKNFKSHIERLTIM